MIDMNGNQKAFNQLARERMKHKILSDILVDMEICKLEGWDVTEYLIDIGNMLNESILTIKKSNEA
jgi:hypothetical protein